MLMHWQMPNHILLRKYLQVPKYICSWARPDRDTPRALLWPYDHHPFIMQHSTYQFILFYLNRHCGEMYNALRCQMGYCKGKTYQQKYGFGNRCKDKDLIALFHQGNTAVVVCFNDATALGLHIWAFLMFLLSAMMAAEEHASDSYILYSKSGIIIDMKLLLLCLYIFSNCPVISLHVIDGNSVPWSTLA